MVHRTETYTILRDLVRLIKISVAIRGPLGLRDSVQQLGFITRSLAHLRSISPMLRAAEGTVLERLVRERPETVGAVVWPYLCADWGPEQRLGRISDHCECIDNFLSQLEFSTIEYLPLLDLDEVSSDLHVVLDQPRWFLREGLLAINLFKGPTRLFTLAFSFTTEESTISAMIGAIQGRNIEGVLEEYKKITKGAEGLRPRDLLLEVFRILCVEIGVKRILAVSDEARHHRSAYFGYPADKQFSTNYNDIWEDRGGRRISPSFYELDLATSKKSLEDVPGKKRGMYRRRYLLLDGMREQMSGRLKSIQARPLEGSID